MHCCSLSHLPESSLRSSAVAVHSDERRNTAVAIAHIGEVEARDYHSRWGFSTISAYCVTELKLSLDAAYNRIRVAHVARRFPVLFEYLIQGETRLEPISDLTLVPERMSGPSSVVPERLVLESAGAVVPERLAPQYPKLAPLSAGHFEFRTTLEQRAHDHLRRLQELLRHQIPSGDLGAVASRAFEIAVAVLEKRKYGATNRPRAPRGSKNPRYIPAHVRRAVRKRDGDHCTFMSHDGRRCDATHHLEFDHIVPIARGGLSTVANVRLLCRAHNQFMADRTYGSQFMQDKRDQAAAEREGQDQERLAAAQAAAEHRAGQEHREAEARAAEAARIADATRIAEENRAAAEARARLAADSVSITSGLQRLGYRLDEAKAATAFSEDLAGDSLEARFKKALTYFAPKGQRLRFARAPEPEPAGCVATTG